MTESEPAWRTVLLVCCPPGWRTVHVVDGTLHVEAMPGWLVQEVTVSDPDSLYPPTVERRVVPGVLTADTWEIVLAEAVAARLWKVLAPGEDEPTEVPPDTA